MRRTFMPFQLITSLAAAVLLAGAASLALVGGGGNSQGDNSQGGNSQGGNYKGGGVAAPGPIAGAGLGYLVLAGGYYVVRRWRKQDTGK